jgi:hypothetical protein
VWNRVCYKMQVLVSGEDPNCLYILPEFLIVISLTTSEKKYCFSVVYILCQFYRSLVVTLKLCNLSLIKHPLLIIEAIVV